MGKLASGVTTSIHNLHRLLSAFNSFQVSSVRSFSDPVELGYDVFLRPKATRASQKALARPKRGGQDRAFFSLQIHASPSPTSFLFLSLSS